MKSKRYRWERLLAGSLLVCLLLATAALLHQQALPSANITTIARIPLGTGPGQLPNVGLIDHIALGGEPSLAACDVDDAGHVCISSFYGDLYFFDLNNKSPQILSRPELAATNYLRYAPQTLWAAGGGDMVDGIWGRLVKMTNVGQPIWELGQHDSSDLRVLPGRPLPRPVPPLPYAPGSTSATAGQSKAEKIGQASGLFAADDRDVFVINGGGRMERFDKDGKFLGEYDPFGVSTFPDKSSDKKSANFSLIAARDGTVYSHFFTRRNERGLTELLLGQWTSPTQHTARVINLRRLPPTTDIYLRAEDGRGNLYFQYHNLPNPPRRSNHMLPMGIARVGLDNIAAEVFDVQAHYGKEIDQARIRPWSPVIDKFGYNIRVGDLIHASPNGDLYLEDCDGQSYRVDKISFGPPASKTP